MRPVGEFTPLEERIREAQSRYPKFPEPRRTLRERWRDGDLKEDLALDLALGLAVVWTVIAFVCALAAVRGR